MIDDRPLEVINILASLRYWDKNNLVLFLDHFVQDNCDKINLWLSSYEITDCLESMSEKELKVQIINLLQNVKKEDKLIFRRSYV